MDESDESDFEASSKSVQKKPISANNKIRKFKLFKNKIERKIDEKKFDGYMNYKEFFRTKYPNFQLKEINENLSYIEKIISSRYFYYIIIYKIISWSLKGMLLIYMFFNKDKILNSDKKSENEEEENNSQKKELKDSPKEELKNSINTNPEISDQNKETQNNDIVEQKSRQTPEKTQVKST